MFSKRCHFTLLAVQLSLLSSAFAQVERIWLTHRSNDPSKMVVNWMTKEPGDSVVRYGATEEYGHEVRITGRTTLHHVEIPLARKGSTYHYSVSTGNQTSPDATFKAYPTDVLRVAVAADWQRKPDLSAIRKDDVHLLLTAGDNISNIHRLCGAGNSDCIKPYAELVDRYPDLFRSTPFMPVLGNHDKEVRPRSNKPPEEPVYDIDAAAFRRFFELPDDEWKWRFDVPNFDVRFVALDLNHISDFGTTWQACHSFKRGSEQFEWYRKLMDDKSRRFIVTLYNERNASIRTKEDGAWHQMFRKGTIAITGFGYYAERAEVDGLTYYNTSLSGKGDQYPDPKSQFIKGEDSYILLTFTRNPMRLVVEMKGLDGNVLDRKEHSELRTALRQQQAPKSDGEAGPAPVQASLIAKRSKYILPKARHGEAFRKRIEEETDEDNLPVAPAVNLILELKNVSNEDVMIWPRGSITTPDLEVEGPGIVGPENLTGFSGESSGTSVQPTIAPGKTHRISIKSLNPGGGTPWTYWCEPGKYTIRASYVVYTGLPPFPFPDDKRTEGKPQRYVVTPPSITVQVVLEGNGDDADSR